MSGMRWLVLVAGLALIGWINWYFFLADASRTTDVPPDSR